MDKPNEAPKGIGDSLENLIFIAAVNITGSAPQPCGGCKKRKEFLNELIPYQITDSPWHSNHHRD